MPPLRRKAPGRPKKNRKRGPDEEHASVHTQRSTTLKCSKCGLFGHNKRTCKREPGTSTRTNTSSTHGVMLLETEVSTFNHRNNMHSAMICIHLEWLLVL